MQLKCTIDQEQLDTDIIKYAAAVHQDYQRKLGKEYTGDPQGVVARLQPLIEERLADLNYQVNHGATDDSIAFAMSRVREWQNLLVNDKMTGRPSGAGVFDGKRDVWGGHLGQIEKNLRYERNPPQTYHEWCEQVDTTHVPSYAIDDVTGKSVPEIVDWETMKSHLSKHKTAISDARAIVSAYNAAFAGDPTVKMKATKKKEVIQ